MGRSVTIRALDLPDTEVNLQLQLELRSLGGSYKRSSRTCKKSVGKLLRTRSIVLKIHNIHVKFQTSDEIVYERILSTIATNC